MSALKNFNISSNFWTANPTLKAITEFREIYESDKTKDKSQSSLLMWSISLYADTSEYNQLSYVPSVDRLSIIEADYYHGKLDLEKYRPLIEKYKRLFLSEAEIMLDTFRKKLEERNTFLMNTPYTRDTMRSLDDALANTNQLHELYKKFKDAVDVEKSIGGAVKGKGSESLSDSRKI